MKDNWNCIFGCNDLPWRTNNNSGYENVEEMFFTAWMYFRVYKKNECKNGTAVIDIGDMLTDCGYKTKVVRQHWQNSIQRMMNVKQLSPMEYIGKFIGKRKLLVNYSNAFTLYNTKKETFITISEDIFNKICQISITKHLKAHELLGMYLYIKSRFDYIKINDEWVGGNQITIGDIIKDINISKRLYYTYRKELVEAKLIFIHQFGSKYSTLFATPNAEYNWGPLESYLMKKRGTSSNEQAHGFGRRSESV